MKVCIHIQHVEYNMHIYTRILSIILYVFAEMMPLLLGWSLEFKSDMAVSFHNTYVLFCF